MAISYIKGVMYFGPHALAQIPMMALAFDQSIAAVGLIRMLLHPAMVWPYTKIISVYPHSRLNFKSCFFFFYVKCINYDFYGPSLLLNNSRI